MRAKTTKKIVYFIGVGGIGMSALARWFLAQNKPKNSASKWAVLGSDSVKSGITRDLEKDGLKVQIGHKNGHISAKIGLVIHSQAIEKDNPELLAARRLGIPTLSYPEAIGRLTEYYKTIAVAGAHGKTTTTALASLILIKGGLDPTVIIGTKLKEFGNKNFRQGKGDYLVLEADEYGKAFLHYSPTVAVITNIDREHLDTYKNLANVKKYFLEFLAKTKRGGTFVLNKDNKILASLSAKIKRISRKNNRRVFWYSIHGNTAKRIKRVIKIPGEHNISDAVAAYKVGRALGVSHEKILSAIGSYHGSWRRMEYRGLFKTDGRRFKVFDDYAHHPTEIRATLRAFKEKYPRSPLVCIYQPHQAKRLRALFKDFENSFGDADLLIFIPMYQVAGRDKTDSRFTSKSLAAAIQKKHPKKQIFYLSNAKNLKGFLSRILPAKNSPVFIMMGAGDIVNYTDLLIR